MPFKPSFWWYDTFDLGYRLSMTGMLLVVSPGSPNIRMIGSCYLAVLCFAFVSQTSPFLESSHNAVLISGQIVVTITVLSGYVVTTYTNVKDNPEQEVWTGIFLIVINIAVVGIAFWQQTTERLHHLLDTIKAQAPFSATEFSGFWDGAAKPPLSSALLHVSKLCLAKIEHGNDDVADSNWEYLTKQLLPLLPATTDAMVWESPASPKDYVPLTMSTTNGRLGERQCVQMESQRSTAFSLDVAVRPPPVMRGWLKKRGAVMNTAWRRRYFLAFDLVDQGEVELLYFVSEAAAERTLLAQAGDAGVTHKGIINLSQLREFRYAAPERTMELECL